MKEVGAMMKRIFSFILSAILFAVAFYLYMPYFSIESSHEIIALIVLFFAIVVLFFALFYALNRNAYQKISTLQKGKYFKVGDTLRV